MSKYEIQFWNEDISPRERRGHESLGGSLEEFGSAL